MLFNSIEFIFFFLPFTLFSYLIVSRYVGGYAATICLVLCSLFFYGWWNPHYLVLLVGSMVFNFQVGKSLNKRTSKPFLVFGVSINLALIAYYKYAGFFANNFNYLTNSSISFGDIILPLAISFFTFQQIAYLVDSYKGITGNYKFVHYSLFVSFFPQLIAGPIVHHKQMLPQFESHIASRVNLVNISLGLSIFAIGLFKKTVLADGISVYATPVFNLVDSGEEVDFFTAWGGALAYTFQLYFDFSGYSDMAIGLARMFGIILPLNFYSPYKATNISEFWRRWHITLSTFLRDYIYIALGGNRKGQLQRYSNLFITMLLGGLWHGAGWNFIIWGALHGSYLIVNHGWNAIKLPTFLDKVCNISFISWLITMIAVVIGWVFFRATTLDGAMAMLTSMAGLNGFEIPNAILTRLGNLAHELNNIGIASGAGSASIFVKTWLWIGTSLIICTFLPNVQDLFSRVKSSLSDYSFTNKNSYWPMLHLTRKIIWRENKIWALITGFALAMGILTLNQISEFLYFQF